LKFSGRSKRHVATETLRFNKTVFTHVASSVIAEHIT